MTRTGLGAGPSENRKRKQISKVIKVTNYYQKWPQMGQTEEKTFAEALRRSYKKARIACRTF